MIAFHYPPFEGGSGVHRTLKFSRYLPEFGWYPIVLSANPTAYSRASDERMREIPTEVPVKRAFAWDTAKHLSIRGRYLKWMALPDRWASWWFAGVAAGLRLVRKQRPSCIWSTYPIATAHLIGLTLHKLTGLPWVVDFRDLMTEQGYPTDPTTWQIHRWIERLSVESCSAAVFTAPGALATYAERYGHLPDTRWKLVPNGYDESDFDGIQRSADTQQSLERRMVLLHSGVLYVSERNPDAFFTALSKLRQQNHITPTNLKIVLRGCGNDDYYRHRLCRSDLQDIVFVEKSIPYRAALKEMMDSDGLLIFQAANCNRQIPAKIFEYFRAQKPILAMTDRTGDTAALMRALNVDSIVDLESAEDIEEGLMQFVKQIRYGNAPIPPYASIERYARKERAKDLVGILNTCSETAVY